MTKKYNRNCPECNIELSYTYKSNYYRAVKNNIICRRCSLGKRKNNTELKHIKEIHLCPDCNVELKYTDHRNLKKVIKKNSKCISCSQIGHKRYADSIQRQIKRQTGIKRSKETIEKIKKEI